MECWNRRRKVASHPANQCFVALASAAKSRVFCELEHFSIRMRWRGPCRMFSIWLDCKSVVDLVQQHLLLLLLVLLRHRNLILRRSFEASGGSPQTNCNRERERKGKGSHRIDGWMDGLEAWRLGQLNAPVNNEQRRTSCFACKSQKRVFLKKEKNNNKMKMMTIYNLWSVYIAKFR